MEIVHRAAVRIICLDANSRVLLLHWQDPADGELLWEPPGGGVEPGETILETARRELVEETGLDPAAIVDRPIDVDRDTKWNGKRYIGTEPFFLAQYEEEAPDLSRLGLLEHEQRDLRGHAWLSRDKLAALTDRVDPLTMPEIIAALAPSSPWADSTS